MDKHRPIVEEYEINSSTMIVVPTTYGGETYSLILELEDEFISPFRPIEIIKNSCHYFGASYEGRKEGTRQLIGITHKVPITIDPTNFIYFFPTTSPSNSQCIWVSHEHVLNHHRHEANQTIVTFRNKQTYILPISNHSFENQLLRTALLRTKLMQRIEQTNRRSFYLVKKPTMRASEQSNVYKNPN
ncbi:competence protein ComK [Cytobacillus spongiae]|jgi:competence protein ComK|uniref:competence protein ComK n=1 Tax=Cytobacillus spongiae TaxID=2901381 RepID=UPI001F462580|nr:competence protein ComK [Cytobacillus spongiae]UII56916.1 competence protein ComK [Cytobacillus spongiae]